MDQRGSGTLSEMKVAEIAAIYGVDSAEIGHVEGGYRNISHSFVGEDGRNYNFIRYKHEPGIAELIQRTNALGTYLAAKGLPVRAPVDDRILRVGRRYGSLYEYLDCATIPWEAYTMKHIKLLGWSMAALHSAGKEYTGTLPSIYDVTAATAARMDAYFLRSDVAAALRAKLSLSSPLPFSEGSDLSEQGWNRGKNGNGNEKMAGDGKLELETALHMDFVRGNVLFHDDADSPLHQTEELRIGVLQLAGILDLEKAARGPVVFDLARTLAFLLVDCPKPADKVRKYFLYSGYAKRGGGTLPDPNELEMLVTFFLTYDFYKFLKQNPYESLPKNHHFKRTVDILLARKVLQYSH